MIRLYAYTSEKKKVKTKKKLKNKINYEKNNYIIFFGIGLSKQC